MHNSSNENITQFYQEIEKVDRLHTHINVPIDDTLSEIEKAYMRIEYFTLNMLNEETILEGFSEENHSNVEYLKNRIKAAHNPLLRAKYSEFIYILTRNNTFCISAIDLYKEALKITFLNTTLEYYELYVEEVFQKIIDLSLRIKYKLTELRGQVMQHLYDSNISDRLKTRLFLTVAETKLLLVADYLIVVNEFISIANKCGDSIWIEHNLNISLCYAEKLQDQSLLRNIYEL